MARLQDKVALVTGAASGIGRGAALALAENGAKVMLTDIDDEAGESAAAEIKKAGGDAKYLRQDVTDEKRWGEIVSATVEAFGGLHILVNNAGIAIGELITEMSLEKWRQQMGINVDGVFLGAKAAIPAMEAAGGGSIVNISSVAGLNGAAGLAGYCATKGAVRLFSKATAIECAQLGNNIRCNSIHPGIIDTAIWSKMDHGGLRTLAEQQLGEALPEGANAMDPALFAANAPLGYVGLPQDIANGIVFLASDESRYVTGSELVIDGGITAR